MIARSIAWKAPTNVRSSVRASPGITATAYAKNTPAISPTPSVASKHQQDIPEQIHRTSP